MSASITPSQYQQWRSIWTPFFPTHTGLFLVRYPSNLLQMTLQTYQGLMKLRLNYLIGEWMEAVPQSQPDTHRLLCHTLSQLNPLQEPPRIEEVWIWRESWADAMIEFNETFLLRLSQYSSDRRLPVPMHPPIPSEQEQLQPLHDEMTLFEWLSELTEVSE